MSIKSCVFFLDDHLGLSDYLKLTLAAAGFTFLTFESEEQLFDNFCQGTPGYLLLDINKLGVNVNELLVKLNRSKIHLPIFFLSGYGNIILAVRTLKSGSVAFLTNPIPQQLLIERIKSEFQNENEAYEQDIKKLVLHKSLTRYTVREKEVFVLAVRGIPNKLIAKQLGISYRTVESHRRRILKKSGAASFLELLHL